MHILYKGDTMPKRIINILLSICLILFSFFYTNKIVNVFKEKDPIMIKLKTYENIDIDKSYQNMKKTGKFNKNLLVFQETNQDNNIKYSYKDYIESLSSKNEISIVFIIKDTNNIINILNILNKKNINATFFLSKEIFDNSFDVIKLIINNGHQVELLSDKYSIYEVNKYNSMIRLISKEKLRFCINTDRDDNLLKSCISSKLYTISPKNNNNTYLYIKNNLKNGLIILFDNSNKTIKELSININYILQKGKKIVLLKNVIE